MKTRPIISCISTRLIADIRCVYVPPVLCFCWWLPRPTWRLRAFGSLSRDVCQWNPTPLWRLGDRLISGKLCKFTVIQSKCIMEKAELHLMQRSIKQNVDQSIWCHQDTEEDGSNIHDCGAPHLHLIHSKTVQVCPLTVVEIVFPHSGWLIRVLKGLWHKEKSVNDCRSVVQCLWLTTAHSLCSVWYCNHQLTLITGHSGRFACLTWSRWWVRATWLAVQPGE